MDKLPGPHGEVPSFAISAIGIAEGFKLPARSGAAKVSLGTRLLRLCEGQGNAQVSETNSENVEVGKRVAEYNAPTKWSVVHGSGCFYRKFAKI